MKISNKTLQSIKFVDFVMEHGMEKAVKVFEKIIAVQKANDRTLFFILISTPPSLFDQ